MTPSTREQLTEVFLEDAREALDALRAGVARLGAAPEAARIAPLLVLTHRLKGAAAQYGYAATADVAGLVDQVLVSIDGVPVSERSRAVQLVVEAIDLLARSIDAIAASRGEEADAAAAFMARQAVWLTPVTDDETVLRTIALLDDAVAGRFTEALQRFRTENARVLGYFLPEASEHLDGMQRSVMSLEREEATEHELAALFRTVHTLKGAAYTVGCAPIGDVGHAIEDLLAAVRDGRTVLTPRVTHVLGIGIDVLRWLLDGEAASSGDRIAGLLSRLHAGARGAEPAKSAPPAMRPAPTMLATDDLEPDPGAPAPSSIRIASDRLDSLLNVVGELIVAKARLDRRLTELEGLNAALLLSTDLGALHGQLAALTQAIREDSSVAQHLIGTLRGEITRARMLRVGGLFPRLAAQVRESAGTAGKTVKFEAGGAAVEVDRAIIEQLSDPLIQLLQNAVSHGLERPDEREAAGKPPCGTLSVRATHRGGALRLEVEDDGRGIDLETLRARAVSAGFVGSAAAAFLSARELLNLIFLPGFTTADAVTRTAGRGVGLDVVRTSLARVNGVVEVETRSGHGTRFVLTIPTAVVISDALLVRAGGETFAVPLAAIALVLAVPTASIQAAGVAETVWAGDQLVDLIRLDAVLGLPASPPGPEVIALVARVAGKSVALAVDELLGKEEIVIKSLGGHAQGIGVFSGGTIAADGRVILVIDPPRVLQAAQRLLPHLAAERSPAPSPPEQPLREPRDSARRFLLVDDSISVRKFVGQMLERAGFDVVTAIDGADALQQLERNAIHAVVTDLEMPRMNGYELIEHLQGRASTRDLPIVVLTSRSSAKDVALARSLGVEHYLTKPVEERALVDLLASLVAETVPTT